jgi:hypothetical protein
MAILCCATIWLISSAWRCGSRLPSWRIAGSRFHRLIQFAVLTIESLLCSLVVMRPAEPGMRVPFDRTASLPPPPNEFAVAAALVSRGGIVELRRSFAADAWLANS